MFLPCRSQMSAAGVTGVVTADVYEQLSDDVVLTTAWVDGGLCAVDWLALLFALVLNSSQAVQARSSCCNIAEPVSNCQVAGAEAAHGRHGFVDDDTLAADAVVSRLSLV
jgi:hypothetical protein